jgi:hypothetical protein
MGLAAWVVNGMSGAVGKASPLYLVMSIAVAIPTYGVCLWWLGEIEQAEKNSLVTLWGRVTGK